MPEISLPIPTSKRSLRLRDKVAILIAVPLLFEVIFVGLLAILLSMAQADAQRLSVSHDVLYGTYKSVTNAFLYSLKKDDAALKSYQEAKADMQTLLGRLREICAKDPEANRSAEIITVLAHREFDDLDLLTQPSKLSFGTYLETAALVGFTNKRMMSECDNITKIQKLHDKTVNSSDWQVRIFAALIVGLIISVAGSAVLARVVLLDLLNRIKMIMRNTDAIARREPLKEEVPGGDEIAALDKFVHATDKSLRELENQRQQFSSMLTHDMRAPLTQIQFSVSLLADGTYEDRPDKRKEMLSTLVPEIAKLNRLVEDLLTANKLDTEPLHLKLEPLPALEVLQEVASAMEIEAHSRKRSIKTSGDDSYVLADPFQIDRVITNLCANALKYAPIDTDVELVCRAEDTMVRFEVIDSGRGVPAALEDHLFERYQQGDDENSRAGYGLGLFIASSIVKAHGGQIGYQSRTGAPGSIFHFTIPRADAREKA